MTFGTRLIALGHPSPYHQWHKWPDLARRWYLHTTMDYYCAWFICTLFKKPNIENLRILKENLPHKFSAWCYYSRAAPILEKEKNGATQKYAMFIRIANDFENVINFFQWRLSNVANVISSLMDYPDIWKMPASFIFGRLISLVSRKLNLKTFHIKSRDLKKGIWHYFGKVCKHVRRWALFLNCLNFKMKFTIYEIYLWLGYKTRHHSRNSQIIACPACNQLP